MKRLRVAAVMLLAWLSFGARSTQAQVCRPAAGACDVAETWTTAAANSGQAMYQPTDGVLYTNVAGDATGGYAFTPNKTIVLTALGGFFNGTKTVYLYDRTNGAVLASATVTAANNWAYTQIAPVTLLLWNPYSVAVYSAGNGAYRASMTSMPSKLADATIEGTCYRPASTAEPCGYSGLIAGTNYGMADIKYLVSNPLYQPTDGTLYTDVSGDFVAGYGFTPNKSLTVTSLGGLWNGTKTVYLFNRSTGAVLASLAVTSANSWVYNRIPPVTLNAGTPYTVAVYSAGAGAYRGGLTSMPSSRADATIDGTCYRPGSSGEPCASSGLMAGNNYGMADIKYAPTGTATSCPVDSFLSASNVCRPAAGTCDVAESCTGSSAACPPDGFAPASPSCTGSSATPLQVPPQDPVNGPDDVVDVDIDPWPTPWDPPPTPVTEDSSTIPVSGDKAASLPIAPVSRSAPVWVTYSFFFSHLAALDHAAAEEEGRGNLQTAIDWRIHEPLAAGLDGRQGALLKQVAAECLAAVEAKDAEIEKGLQAFRADHPEGDFVTAQLPPELKALWQQRIDIVERQIRRLQSLLGDEGFHKLDSYIRANFAPVVVEPGQGAAEGGVR